MGNLITETPYSEITATLELLGSLGVSRKHLEYLRKHRDSAQRVAEAIVNEFPVLKAKNVAPNAFRVTVDYYRSLAQMIQSGKYDWVNLDITEKNFPVKGTGKQEVVLELLHFKKVMSSDRILAEMKNRGLRPATLPELLAFGEKYPDEQRKYPIVALGSVWRDWGGGRGVPCLWGGDGDRVLDLDWFEYDWGEFYRFLTVRES